MNLISPYRCVSLIVAGVLASAIMGCAPQDQPRQPETSKEKAALSHPDGGTRDSMVRPASSGSRRDHGGGLSVSTTTGGDNSPLEYDAPEGWGPDKPRGMRRAVFHVTQDDQKVEITVIELPGSVEALLPNVNRWRKELQLGQITQAELEEAVSSIQVDGAEGRYIELVGPEDAQPRLAMLRVLAATGDGRTWLLSMTGDAELVLREKERFQGFVRSVKLAAADTSKNDE